MREDDFIVRLNDLSDFLERHTDLDESLNELASMAADALNAENCSIMLLSGGEDDSDFGLRVLAHSGHLPEEAYREAMKLKQGISGYVVATRRPLLVADIEKSQFSSVARHHYRSNSLMSAPILIHQKVVGVIHVNTPRKRRSFRKDDLNLLYIVALLVGKSIQAIQLQKLMNSRYTIFAMAQEKKGELNDIAASARQDLDRVAKLLAKTFFKEMNKAGFGSDHILNAASEIVSLLNEKVARHKKRLKLQ
jgi:L-methionine (R)-S-oxide reductase